MVDRAVLSREVAVQVSYRLFCTHSLMERVFGYEPGDGRSNRSGCTVASSNGRKSV